MLTLKFRNEPDNIVSSANGSGEINVVVEKSKPKLDNSNIIKNISTDQSEILWNIMQLYNNGEPFEADMTASELKFYGDRKGYKYNIPVPRILMDVYPLRDDIIKITPFQPLPLEENSIKSCLFDPPFTISPKTCASVVNKKEGANLISNRFSSFYPVQELYTNYAFWCQAVYKVMADGGIFVTKSQSTISGGYSHNSEEWMFLCAVKAGFYCIDKFILEAKARLISPSKYKKQVHARKYTSVFHVFKKDDKKANKFNYLKMIEEMSYDKLLGMEWPVK